MLFRQVSTTITLVLLSQYENCLLLLLCMRFHTVIFLFLKLSFQKPTILTLISLQCPSLHYFICSYPPLNNYNITEYLSIFRKYDIF